MSNGTISSAGRSISTRRLFPIRCWCARTALISTRFPRSSTTSISRITHVIRGEDHVVNTAVQIEIFEALGGTRAAISPITACSPAPTARACRSGWDRCRSPRCASSGLEAMAVVSHAALLGTSDSIHPCADYRRADRRLRSGTSCRARRPVSMRAELRGLNARLLHMLPYAAVKDRLARGRRGLLACGARQSRDARRCQQWWTVSSSGDDRARHRRRGPRLHRRCGRLFCRPSHGTARPGRLDRAVKAETGRKGKALFMPLRLALTGLDHGPELAALLPLIGRERAMKTARELDRRALIAGAKALKHAASNLRTAS